eukprot:TRINITY_DN7716_c0_g1_i1.p1 TRINITY_DN7716_c0_g1~~TRINITY_DN7716_c0_g1_i1.p1  ORF type:complete len:635 (+),score=126.32 TRINITY_DN7716_c0_g1_i1:177-2081(+)
MPQPRFGLDTSGQADAESHEGPSFSELVVCLLAERAKADADMQRLRLELRQAEKASAATEVQEADDMEHKTHAHLNDIKHHDIVSDKTILPPMLDKIKMEMQLSPLVKSLCAMESMYVPDDYTPSAPRASIRTTTRSSHTGVTVQSAGESMQTTNTSCVARVSHRSRRSRMHAQSSTDSSVESLKSLKEQTRAKGLYCEPGRRTRFARPSRRDLVLSGEDMSLLSPSIAELDNILVAEHDTLRSKVCRLLKWWPFDAFVAFVIILDFIVLGISIQRSLNPGGHLMEAAILDGMDKACTVIYIIELTLRFCAFGMRYCMRNNFIRLDAFLVLCSVFDISLRFLAEYSGGRQFLGMLPIFRVLRVARIARAARLTMQHRTLWLLVSGLGHSGPTIFWTFIMITCISYAFALLGMEMLPPRDLNTDTLFNEVAVKHFGNLTRSMLTLLQVLTLDSICGVYWPLITEGDKGILAAVYFILYILVVSVSLMNLVTAVTVEGALQQAHDDKEFQERLEEERKRRLVPHIREMFAAIDADGSGEVCLDELMNAPEDLKQSLMALTGSWSWSPVEIFTLIDDDDSGVITVEEFLEGLLKCSQPDGFQQLQMQRLARQVGMIKTMTCDKDRDCTFQNTVSSKI